MKSLRGQGELPEGWPEALDSNIFVVVDTETTGLDPHKDRILSLGAVKIRNGTICVNESVEVFLKQEHFDQTTVPIHGILREGRHMRISEQEAMEEFRTYSQDAVLVGHHLAFDLKMMEKALERAGLPELDQPCLDTGLLYRKSLINSPLLRKKEYYSLDDLAHKFDLSCKDRHTALGDAYITALAFLHILERLEGRNPLDLSSLLKMGRVH